MARLYGFQKKELIQVYENMVLSRILDEKMAILLRQGKGFFHMACSGHEAAQTAAAFNLQSAKDWFYPYYRDSAFTIGLGMTAKDHLLAFFAKSDDPSSGGRQMPHHYGKRDLNIVTQSSPTGTQYLQAVGCAMACKLNKKKEVVYVSSGEGTTSQGDFHEALNWSSREKLPVIFHIEDNDYAISVHISEQISGESIFSMVSGYQHLARFDVDGSDYFETHLAFKKAVDRARKGMGPAVIVSHVDRLKPHSSSDDHLKYRTKKEITEMEKNDPIKKFTDECIANKIIKMDELDKLDKKLKSQVEKDADWAESKNHPDSESATNHIYSGYTPDYSNDLKIVNDRTVFVDAINHALSEEMARNKKMIIYGQDIADPKGGVFTATKGLTGSYGKDRVFNSPLAESSIIGSAIGLATVGYKPVVEIQFGDYIWTAMMQIRNELATIRYRSNNAWSCPAVIRVPVGGYIHGGLCHSQSIDGYFIHMPGIYIAYPSNASDAKGLLKMACRMDDPVIFMEHKSLYRQSFASSPEPDDEYLIPFGESKIVQKGSELTIVTWGAMVQSSIEAVNNLDLDEDVVEIIDLRTLNPLDFSSIKASIEKTGKALIVYEDNLTNGPGAEISSLISDHCFEMLDGPIRRVASKDSPVPYNMYLEENVLVQVEDIKETLIELLEY
ncbi:MAG: dehydrogenase E1 component subunit alpha/beta [Candidatus Marinimicrobia bacterium]|nr:dehydrogenase E1 component subunit alpha/beta [Candidatus Neomarinimicrobiota bacterium]